MQLCIEFQRSFFRDIDLVTKNAEFELKRNNVLSKWDVGNNDLAYNLSSQIIPFITKVTATIGYFKFRFMANNIFLSSLLCLF